MEELSALEATQIIERWEDLLLLRAEGLNNTFLRIKEKKYFI